MKWENYNKLKPKDKEEYNYCYKDNNIPKTRLLYVGIMWFGFVFVAMVYLLVYNQIIESQLMFTNVYMFLVRLGVLMLYAWIGEYLIGWGYYIYKEYKKYKWVKTKIPDIKWYKI